VAAGYEVVIRGMPVELKEVQLCRSRSSVEANSRDIGWFPMDGACRRMKGEEKEML
jgi:hypothetical protein